MPTLLHIDFSPLTDTAISRALSAEFVRIWRTTHPQGEVITRDLATLVIPPIDAAWIQAAFTDPAARTTAQTSVLALSDQLIDDIVRADTLVIGVPMHNFAPPATFKLWIDQIVRIGKTYARQDGKPIGLLSDKSAYVVVSSGGEYATGSPTEKFDFVSAYLRTILGYIGISDVRVHAAGGTAAVQFGKISRSAFLQPHFEAIAAEVQQSR